MSYQVNWEIRALDLTAGFLRDDPDRERSGRPRVFPAGVVAEVKAMACEPPEDRGVPQSRWSAADLAAQAVAGGPHAEHRVLRRATPLLPFVSRTAETSGTITPRGGPAAAGRRGYSQAA